MNRVQIQIIKDALDQEHELDEWESGFINNLADKDADYELSDTQNHHLNKIGSKLA